MSASPALQIDGLVKSYGQRTVVDGISFEAASGEVLALLGPNGAGKTTTIETCIGFRDRDGGNVSVLGLDPKNQAAELKPRIGVMLQSGGIYQSARAREMLKLVASYYEDPLDPDMLLERLGLSGKASTAYRNLSVGQQQRLSLAIALIGRPELVFLDEPTVGLDPQARHESWRIIQALRNDGVSVVLTTHYMDEAQRLADQVVIIDHGKVIATGTPTELIRSSAQPEMRFTASAGLDTGSLAAWIRDSVAEVGSELKVSEAPGAGGRYFIGGTAVNPQLVAAVAGWFSDNGVLLDGLQVAECTLEDVFLELTGRELRS